MSDNSSDEKESIQKLDIKGNDAEEKNTPAKAINEIENENPIPSTIKDKINQNSAINNSTIINLNNEIKENNSPYLYKDKIPEIKIKNENELVNGENIETFINYPFDPNFDDNIYNICENCRKNNNYCFCGKCFKNLCDSCSEDCNKIHKNEIMKLKPDEIYFYKSEIERIIGEYFIEPENKEENNEKDQKSYQVIDENKIIIESFKKSIYTNDIILINFIIHKNYNNYFHYKNIENCYKYIKWKYDIKDQILLEYVIKSNETKIRIFGLFFVLRNKRKGFIIYEDKEFELMEFFELENNINNNILKIKLIGINNIIDISYMFCNCSSLIFLPDISKWNTEKVNNMSYMFFQCSSLISLPGISEWNTNNVTDMNNMFYNCSSLISLPDISKWNVNKVTSMYWMFNKCSSLISLPDISKWNITKVHNLISMFSNCSSLISLPDISKWNTNNVSNMYWMFTDCLSLIYAPDMPKKIKKLI